MCVSFRGVCVWCLLEHGSTRLQLCWNQCCVVLAAHLHIKRNGNLTEEKPPRPLFCHRQTDSHCSQSTRSFFHTHTHECIKPTTRNTNNSTMRQMHTHTYTCNPVTQNSSVLKKGYTPIHPRAHLRAQRRPGVGLWMTAIQICCSLWSTLSRKHHDEAGFSARSSRSSGCVAAGWRLFNIKLSNGSEGWVTKTWLRRFSARRRLTHTHVRVCVRGRAV